MKNRLSLLLMSLTILVFSTTAWGQNPTPTPSPAPAATPPPSDIFMVDLLEKGRTMRLGEPRQITGWAGYNNQPSFLADGRSILYTSIREGQADIYRYSIPDGVTTRITQTPESEYSPTLTLDGKWMSVVRVEGDGTQRLWKFPLGSGSPSLVLENIKPVGYHAWLDDYTLALFILGSSGKPHTLQLADMRTGKTEVIIENPGRILRRVPKQNKLSFVHKVSEQEWIIKTFDLKSREITELTKTFTGVEDYAWTPGGVLLMARDSKIFVRKKGDYAWEEIGDLSKAGLKGITRIAVSPKGDRIAIVARRG